MTTANEAKATTESYRTALETRDVELAMSTFSVDAVLHSPLTQQAHFTGHAEIRALVEVAFTHLDQVHFHTDVGDARTRVVVYTARVRGIDMEEAALLQLGDDGRIAEVTLFIRPLPGLVEVMDSFGPDIARRNGRHRVAKLLGIVGKPLRTMVRSGDRFVVPLATLNR